MFSVYVAVVLMTFGRFGVLSSSPSLPVSDWGRVSPAGMELPIGAQPRVPTPQTNEPRRTLGSPVDCNTHWANQTNCSK